MYSSYIAKIIADEINRLSRYSQQLLLSPHLGISLSDNLENKNKQKVDIENILEALSKTDNTSLLVLANSKDFSLESLENIKKSCKRNTRVVAVLANYFNTEQKKQFFKNSTESGFEVVRNRCLVFSPFHLWGLGAILNKALAATPLLRSFGAYSVITLRPKIAEKSPPSLSIIIPARNEQGNIQATIERMPSFGEAKIEIIYIEGHSTDGTWKEIQSLLTNNNSGYTIKAFQQTGVGKSDAVRLGFSKASHELLAILDADLTMPPELLPKFYDAYCQGLGDFINGDRLHYPMEQDAMRFLNKLGNLFFAKCLSFILDANIGDSLCGTKLFLRSDYLRMQSWREDFGDLDPFGDFELLFPAAVFGLGIVNIPIHYKSRTYGSTNISRFRNGWQLAVMSFAGLCRIRAG